MILRHPKAPLFFGILVIIGLVAYVTFYRSSPGDLSRPHAAIAGSTFITDCNKCHAQKDTTPGCLACHTEIQAQFNRNAGFHPFLLKGKSITCARCHSEHNGPDFALVSQVSWENQKLESFRHPHVAFQLKGAHAKLACASCHQGMKTPAFTLPKFPKMRRKQTFLGLSQACISCHADPHAGGRASACASCHNQDRWKPAPLFNHEKFFSLKGAHARVACNQCHTLSAKPAPVGSPLKIFGPVRGKRCIDCHANPHKVEWRKSCESCHRLDRPWSSASVNMMRETHALTGFRLNPPHQKVSCQACHAQGRTFAQRYPQPRRMENRCESCHADPHRGQFTAKHAHCTDCHGSLTFKPSKWTVRDHTIFPLIGAHATASCNACHRKNSQTGVRQFAGTPRDCAACHRDIHMGQFREAGQTRCQRCHLSPRSWTLVVFNHNTQSRFKLDQAHANVACKECHPVVSLSNGTRLTQYKPIRHECRDCHDFER